MQFIAITLHLIPKLRTGTGQDDDPLVASRIHDYSSLLHVTRVSLDQGCARGLTRAFRGPFFMGGESAKAKDLGRGDGVRARRSTWGGVFCALAWGTWGWTLSGSLRCRYLPILKPEQRYVLVTLGRHFEYMSNRLTAEVVVVALKRQDESLKTTLAKKVR